MAIFAVSLLSQLATDKPTALTARSTAGADRRDDKKGSSSAVVSHSSPKTGLEWGTQPSLPVKEAGHLEEKTSARVGSNERWVPFKAGFWA
jgi:hypothetical protein